MYKPERTRILLPLALAGALSACGPDSGGGMTPPDPSPPAANQPPVVTAEPLAGETLELTAVSLSVEASDPDGDELTFEWKQAAGTPVEFDGGDTAKISFTAPKVVESETLSFTVTVSDGNDHDVTETTGILVNEGETVVMLASLVQPNAIEAFRKHAVDSQAIHLDIPVPSLTEDERARADGIRISPDRKHVAWIADHDMNDSYELMIAEVAGHEARSLTPDIDPTIHEDVLAFRWSPDGQSIAYLKDDDVDGNQIFVVNINSKESNAHRISGEATYSDIDPDNGSIDAVINDFRWSPDSSAIAFIGQMEDHTLLYLADAITENRMEIDVSGISLQGGIDSFAWSPDGSQIAMIERLDDLDNEALSLVDTKTGSWQTLVNYEDGVNDFFGFSAPRYSPDGQYIAFVAEDSVSGVAHLHVVSTDKSSLRRVSGDTSEATAEVSEFEWSPDGKSLAFIGNFETADNDELFVVGRDTEVNGNDRRKISGSLTDLDTPPDGSLNGDVEEFEWSPDGEQIAFVGQDLKGEFDKEIFIVAVSGDSNDRRLVSGASTDHNGDGIPDSWFNEIRWSPAGTHLYFKGNVQDVDADGLFKVAADSTDGGDRVSVSGPVAPEGGVVSEYDVGGPSN